MNSVPILLTALLLGACVGGAKNVPPAAVYDFGLPAARLPAGGTWSALALEVRSPSWFDSLNVDYRLAYDDPLQQREYAGSRWAGAPGVLLAQRLRQQLGAVSATGSTAADCLLRVDVHEFSQVFDSPQQSRGVLQGSVGLTDSRRQLIAERQVDIDQPAATADANGGVNALVLASAELARQLADWLAGLERSGALKACRSARVSSARQ
jgi:ABC-type uncharacterized transport system auxiliary subunit